MIKARNGNKWLQPKKTWVKGIHEESILIYLYQRGYFDAFGYKYMYILLSVYKKGACEFIDVNVYEYMYDYMLQRAI